MLKSHELTPRHTNTHTHTYVHTHTHTVLVALTVKMMSLIITRGRWVLTNTCSDVFLYDCYHSIPWQHLRHKKRRRCRSLHTHTQPHLPLLHHAKPEQTLATGSLPPTSPPPTSHVPLEEKLASMKLHNSAPARLQSLQRKKVMIFTWILLTFTLSMTDLTSLKSSVKLVSFPSNCHHLQYCKEWVVLETLASSLYKLHVVCTMWIVYCLVFLCRYGGNHAILLLLSNETSCCSYELMHP